MAFIVSRILGFLFMAVCVSPAFAGVVSIEVDPSGKSVTVDADEASLDEVLTKLGESEGFSVKRLRQDEKVNLVSGRFEGPVSTVLMRILDRENHMIEHSGDAKAGIARVVLYGSGQNAPGQDLGANVIQSPQTAVPVTPQTYAPQYQAVVTPQQIRPVQPMPVQQQPQKQGQRPSPQVRQPRGQQQPSKPAALRRGPN